MSYLQKIALAVLAFFVLSFVSGYIIWFNDLTKHRADLMSFIKLATHDALINIQTTEEQGMNFTSAYAVAVMNEKYEDYVKKLLAVSTLAESEKETLETIQKFLDKNLDVYKTTNSGDALFRPIQFGMTFLDSDLFEESFKESLQNLIEINYNSNHTDATAFTCYDALHAYIDDIEITISDPQVVSLSATDNDTERFLLQLYGIDKAQEYIEQYNSSLADASNLGISVDVVPSFYVYYDISISVPWGSSTAFPFLGKELWESMGFTDIEYSDAMDGQKQFIRWHSDSTVESYSYRYVLLN